MEIASGERGKTRLHLSPLGGEMRPDEPVVLPISKIKRRASQRKDKKGMILRGATEVFAERGFSEATISQIARKVNIAEGSIYHYFKNKEDLLFSIPEERMAVFLSTLHEQLQGIRGALNKLRKLIWFHLYYYEKNRDYALILFQNIRINSRFNSTRAYRLIQEFSRLVVQIIEEGKKEGVIRGDINSRLLRDAILGAVEHVTIRGSILGRAPTLTETAAPLYDFFTSGIQAQEDLVTVPLKDLRKMLRPKLKPSKRKVSEKNIAG